MATEDDDDDDDDGVKGGRAEGGMRRGVGIDGKGWRCGGRGQRSHNNDVFFFSHSHSLSLCIITALPVMGATTVTALLKAGSLKDDGLMHDCARSGSSLLPPHTGAGGAGGGLCH